MHLEDVVVEGFKSFSEPTSMSFQPGIGVIIGNNGVGKSNILDAIVWAMGEDDFTRLRCQEVEELFFFGSRDYPPAERIRVELNLRRGREKDAPVVRLFRELSRGGKETYGIQNDSCRKEVYQRELEGLRLSHALKTIVNQERINDMLAVDSRQRYGKAMELLGPDGTEAVSRQIREEIGPLFRRYLDILIPQGEGQLQLLAQDGGEGLEVEVTLPGNRRRRAHQLSGGEKSVVSLALKMAIFAQLDSPLYLLDEVEPSLDYTNHKSMQTFLKTLAGEKQLIMITHLRSTIELANTVHGVRTRWDGSSFMKFYFVMDERLLRLYKCC